MADPGETNPWIAQLTARLDQFTVEELVHLSRLIVERLRLMQQINARNAMTQFRIGQRVRFTNGARQVVGTLTKYNRKSVTVIAETGEQWTAPPGMLRSEK